MSLNTIYDDTNMSRSSQAIKAGHTLYGSIPSVRDQNPGSPTGVHIHSSSFYGHHYDNDSRRISAVRRTFCLLVLFDLILTFILWVIYTQLVGETPIWHAFFEQVENFTFQSSLFDTVMLAAVRFTILILAYALFRVNHWWTIALTTFMTCVFLLAKVFLFKFINAGGKSENPLSYALLIIAFVMSWVETWFMDFKVLPQEKKDRERAIVIVSNNPLEQIPLHTDRGLYSRYHAKHASKTNECHSTLKGGLYGRYCVKQASKTNQFHSALPFPKEQDYIKAAQEAWDHLWELVKEEDHQWKLESGHDVVKGCVHSRHVKKHGRKSFRLQGIIEISPENLYNEMVNGLNNSPDWNPTILECRTLETLDDHSEISYNVAAEAAGGLVSSRDFINVRRWGQKDGIYLSAGSGVHYPSFKATKKYVRGENGPGGWVFRSVPDNPQQCLFTWFINTDLKGWIPKAAIDQALAGVLLEYLEYLRKHIEDVKLKIDYS
ncbi:hypothetical protein ScPMuIL_012608 [Solemya velum]